MRNNTKFKSKNIAIFFFILLFSLPIYAEKIIQGIIQDSENIIVAKGDIPTPEKFKTDILKYREKAVEQLTQVEKALNKLIINSEKISLLMLKMHINKHIITMKLFALLLHFLDQANVY
ncbi:hypothetical protein LW139_04035 [Proteus vulgaris]|uniref:hypothetical protein n=1 Tax=Proteus vulgaris TaxID=585 RepID=UPI001FFE3679|nr:hypothetical protein [Proteus vulgaris]UPK81888.1 hypothetical protein LW139_04035 [Proteus vulgaris]